MAGYHYFLAHAGPDAERARELRERLLPDVLAFLDCYDLAPGDNWDVELPRRQRLARATVALVSAATESAYYLREEIAAAIAYQRRDPTEHRLIAVYLDGVSSDPAKIPYGLRIAHTLDAARLGWDGVAAELKAIAAKLGQPEIPAALPTEPAPVNRIAVFDALCKLLPAQFEVVLFRSSAPAHDLAPATEPRSRRALDPAQWAEQGGPTRVQVVAAAIGAAAPGLLP